MRPRSRKSLLKTKLGQSIDSATRRLNLKISSSGFKAKWPHMLLAIMLALLCWYMVAGRETVESWMDVPIQFSGMSDSIIVSDDAHNKITLHLRGPKNVLRWLDDRALAYVIDARSFSPGYNEVYFSPERISVPTNVQIVSITPPKMTLNIDSISSKTDVPIFLNLPREVKDGRESLIGQELSPNKVTIRGPQTLVAGLASIMTAEIPYSPDQEGLIETRVNLNLPDKITADISSIKVRLKVTPKLKAAWVSVPVKTDPPDGFRLTLAHSHVQMHISCPDNLFQDQAALVSKIALRLEIPDGTGPGTGQFGYDVSLPANCSLIDSNPNRLSATLIAK